MAIPGRVNLWRGMPPAVYPPIMGLFGLSLAWRRAVSVFGLPAGIADLLLGAVTMGFIVVLVAYAAKFITRPAVLIEDLKVLPGRTGMPALSMSVMLLAGGLMPLAPGFAKGLLLAGLALHGVIALLVLYVLSNSPTEGRVVTPAWHLAFVGFIVSPLAAVPLGMTALAEWVLWCTMLAAAAIYAASAVQLIRRAPPPPLRPLLAIHLAPVALFGTAAALLGMTSLALVFAGIAGLVLTALLVGVRYLAAAGFSPFWGAFTFPLAAFAGLMLALAGQGALFRVAGGITLFGATLLIPWIAAKILQLWIKGVLTVKSNAAIA
ncbi:tellurium resistance protein [Pseudoruegeria sp. HB172150]|uniref:SLAC1 family transporter n=1 Tax=Pseudoruegeria sp. HB172150 TaxID=2721164 RepID=UPI0015545C82|nr:tellurium resistance protein [Pseudoruegeria sp. HB172150]